MKRKLALLFILIFSFNLIYANELNKNNTEINLNTEAKAVSLISARSGQVLYQKNGDTAMPCASTTKILTAIIIMEDMDLKTEITASESFINPGGSNIAIDHGETLTIKDLLYALLLESANDAAVVLAEAHSGSTEEFAKIMNQRAREIGAVNSNFVTVNGLDHPEHYSTTNDMAKIAAYAIKNPVFREIVKTKTYTIAPTNKKNEARNYINNHNLFLMDNGEKMTYNNERIAIYDPRIDGIKTGYTDSAGYCLLSSLETEGSRYIAVVFGAPSQNSLYASSKSLLDYASYNYKRVKLVEKGTILDNIKVKGAESSGLNLVAAETIILSLPLDTEEKVAIEPKVERLEINYPIKMGMTLAKATYTLADGNSFIIDLVAERDIKNLDFIGEMTEVLSAKKITSYLDIIVIILKLIVVFVIWRWLIGILRRKRAKKIRQAKLAEIRNSNNSNVVDFNAIKNQRR